MKQENLEACLLGGALGDSLGLPSEGMYARRIAKLRPGSLHQCLIGGKGMVSDDTEHAAMTLLSLRQADQDPEVFARKLAGRLRWWFLALPAGIGLATAKSIIRLLIGFSPAKSGVWSAGNGPLMRAPVIGVWFSDDEDLRTRFVDASTRITHKDPRAVECARIIAHLAAIASSDGTNRSTQDVLKILEIHASHEDNKQRFALLANCLNRNDPVEDFANLISQKPGYVTGFAPDSAAVAIYAWLRHRDHFRESVESVIRCGGDTDTIAFIVGSLAGVDCGISGLPADWINDLRDWTLNRTVIHRITTGATTTYPIWPLALVRNLVFLAIVLCHGFRRTLPPY